MNEVCEVYQNFILKQTYIYFQIDCNPFSDLRQRLLLRSNEPNNSDVNPRDLIDLNADQVVPRGEMSNHTRQASVIIPPLVRFTTPPPPIQPTGQSNRPARPPSRRASADTPIPSIQILEALLIGDGSGPQANGTEHVIIRKYFSDNQWFCAWCCVDYCQGREKEFCEFVYAHESVTLHVNYIRLTSAVFAILDSCHNTIVKTVRYADVLIALLWWMIYVTSVSVWPSVMKEKPSWLGYHQLMLNLVAFAMQYIYWSLSK